MEYGLASVSKRSMFYYHYGSGYNKAFAVAFGFKDSPTIASITGSGEG